MAVALEVGFDLGVLAAVYILIAFLEVLVLILTVVVGVFDVPIFGTHPFKFVGDAITNTAIKWSQDAIKSSEHVAASFQNGLLESLLLVLIMTGVAIDGTAKALGFLWNTALPAYVNAELYLPRLIAHEAKALVVALADTVADNLAAARVYARDHALLAQQNAEAYTNDVVGGINTELLHGIDEVRRISLSAVEDLRIAEDAAVKTAEDAIGKTLGELHDLQGLIPFSGIAGLIAAVPLLSALVQTLEAETGLGNKECRDKVKGICATDPLAWGNLLGGLAAIGFAFSLRELYNVAAPLATELEPIIRKAA